jgi:biotin carboxylase
VAFLFYLAISKSHVMTILCISTYYKGIDFLKEAKKLNNRVFLLTHSKLKDKPWPKESIDEFYYLDKIENTFDVYQTIINGISGLFRSQKIDLVVALDDFDVEKAALVREHFRIPGMGQTTARYFRDKLAMRMQASDKDIPVPPFTSLFHDQDITDYLNSTQGPWLIKPRAEASATGIKKVANFQDAWDSIHELGDERHNYLIEQFKPGDVYHVDSLIIGGKVVFTSCSQYLSTPFEVAHGGGIFRSVSVEHNTIDEEALSLINNQVMKAFGMQFSASHTEVIKSHETGEYYFLETASRVGGAHLADMVEAASGVNLWKEWAKIETSVAHKTKYANPKPEKLYAGILITLSSQEKPSHEPFNDVEVIWRMEEEYHFGLIVKSKSREKVIELLDKYAHMVHDLGYHASAPAPDKPTH